MSATDCRHPDNVEYWAAYLAAHIAHAIPEVEGHAKKTLRAALMAFMRSACCSTGLAETIRKSTKGEASV